MRAVDAGERVYANRPFAGARGAALYLGYGDPDPGPEAIRFRRNRVHDNAPFCRLAELDPGANETKTAAVAFCTSPTAALVYELPADAADTVAWFQVRTHDDDVENTTLWRPRRVVIDADLDADNRILGTAALIAAEKRDGGGVRFRFRYLPVRDGLQPEEFQLVATDGPTSPDPVSISYGGSSGEFNLGGGFGRELDFEIDVAGLEDEGEYTFEIRAVNGAVEAALIETDVTADASGPAAPTASIAEY